MPTFFGVLTHSCRLTRKELFEKNVARSSLFAAVPALLACRPPALPVAALLTCLSKRGPRPRCRNIGVAQTETVQRQNTLGNQTGFETSSGGGLRGRFYGKF